MLLAAAKCELSRVLKGNQGGRASLQVGGRLGNVFDEDPKRWRMLAETLATLGLSLEISTAFFPGMSSTGFSPG